MGVLYKGQAGNTTNQGIETMTAIQKLHLINNEFQAQLHMVNQLSMSDWVKLASDIGVDLNNREFAAKKLALRKLVI
jgi:hypothetical protein